MKKLLLIIIMIPGISSCAPVVTQELPVSIPFLSLRYIQPDSCLTNKQVRRYLNFVKDSMRIAARLERKEIKYIYKYQRDSIYLDKVIYKLDTKRMSDSLKTIRIQYKDSLKHWQKAYSDSMRAAVPIHRQSQKTERKELQQDGKTTRVEKRQSKRLFRMNWWMWLGLGFISGMIVNRR